MPSRFGVATRAILVSGLFLALWHGSARAAAPEAESHFRNGLELEKKGNFAAAVDEYMNAVWIDWSYAEPYDRMALLLMERGDVQSNKRAGWAIKKAIEIDPNNAEYHITYGKLYQKTGFDLEAEYEFRRARSLDRDNVEALMSLGLNAEAAWNNWRNARSMAMGGFSLAPHTVKDYQTAVDCFRKVLALEPDQVDAFLRLFLMYYDEDKRDDLEALVESHPEVWNRHPDDYHTWLYQGMALQAVYRFEEAGEAFKKALAMMPDQDREVFASIDLIISPDQERKLKGQIAMAAQGEPGDPEGVNYIDRLWQGKDPLHLTEINERELEHYRRIAYADIRFGDPAAGLRGYDTDRGRLYVRYGEPKARYKIRPKADFAVRLPEEIVTALAATPNLSFSELEQIYRGYVPRDLGGYSLEMEDMSSGDFTVRYTTGKEVWDYGEIVLTFEDWSGNEKYKMIPDPNNDLPTFIKEKPDMYEPDFGGEDFDLYGYYSTFRGEKGKTILDLSFAIPTRRVEFNPYRQTWARTDLNRGLFLFDNDWNEVFHDIKSNPLYVRTMRDSVPDELIIDQRCLDLDPGLYHMSVEVQDQKTRNTSVSRRELLLPEYGYLNLEMSDIIAAQKIDTEDKIGYTRKDVTIENNPSRVFRKSWLLHVYYEIYNLLPDPGGRTRYRIETTVAEPNWKRRAGVSRFFHELSRVFGADPDKAYISLASEYRGIFHTQSRYETIDVHNLAVQRYLLNIRVTDLIRGTFVDKDFIFAVTRDVEGEVAAR